ncbi:hypothetical protein RGJ03_001673 [Serratia marcescens]
MDFSKFVDFISSRKLFLCRTNLFKDKFEGVFPRQQNNVLKNAYLEIVTKEKMEDFIQDSNLMMKNVRATTYVSCWHANEYESAAMWDLYAKTDEAIAIETTYESLKNSLPENSFLGLVDYIDYETETIPIGNMFNPVMHKRRSFQHENEARVVIRDEIPEGGNFSDIADKKNGIYINVDINKLIKRVYVSPTSPTWFVNLVTEISNKYELTAKIIKSDLYTDPIK